MADSTSVRHEPENHRFVLDAGADVAVAEYRLEDKLMILTHTWVPPEARGQGAAARLIEAALAYARGEQKKIVPQCSYVEMYLRRHPEQEDLRA